MLRVLSIALCAAALFAADQQSGRVPGLQFNVEILVDRWGVPHIYAQNLHDAYFAQGWNAATQRLWQMDLWRKRGLGLLSADFGEAYLAQDRAARLMLYRGDVEAEWKLYTPGMRQVLEAFSEGINAWVRTTEQDPSRLSWEFRLTGSKPALWKPADLLIIRSAALSANLSSEVDRAKLACKVGVTAPTLRERLTVPWTPQAPEGLDPCSIPDRVLDDYRLGRQTAVNFGAAKGKPAAEGDAPPQVESNNWAISAQRSATGRAILATDPHRPFSVPAFRYFAHLSYPGLDIVGFGEPQHPGFVFGHNGSIAWGQTTYQVDMEDLYVYDVGAGDSYKYRGEWRPMKIVRDHVPVKGGASREVTLKFTQHGPVIFEDPSKHRAYALRTAWLEPGSATFLGSIGLNKARDWDEFSQELNRYRVPGNNVVYADVKGNVGLAPVGNAPRRPNWDGLYPVPGDGRYEWEGIRPNSELPRTYNPADGFVASANNLPYWLSPKEYAAKKIGFEFGQDRISRIREVLGGPGKISFETALNLQNDYKVGAAARLIPYAKGVHGAEMLAEWDLVLTKDSAAGALYELWVIELTNARAGTVDAGRPADVWLKGMPAAERGRIVGKTLAAALAHAEQLMGHDPKQWAWGKLHHLRLEHALTPVADAALRDKINVGGRSAGKGGESTTVGNLGYDRKSFRITSGNSSRFVIDVGNWDASRFLHVPGQSGDPDTAEYRNLLESWVKEEYNPLLYTRKAVEAATVRRVVLAP
ncbi:MAG: penicillin acylase family protein [Bryobacterales bacterium]|nr:penicillin acylase family protein [Bryobacterales bacterium]